MTKGVLLDGGRSALLCFCLSASGRTAVRFDGWLPTEVRPPTTPSLLFSAAAPARLRGPARPSLPLDARLPLADEVAQRCQFSRRAQQRGRDDNIIALLNKVNRAGDSLDGAVVRTRVESPVPIPLSWKQNRAKGTGSRGKCREALCRRRGRPVQDFRVLPGPRSSGLARPSARSWRAVRAVPTAQQAQRVPAGVAATVR